MRKLPTTTIFLSARSRPAASATMSCCCASLPTASALSLAACSPTALTQQRRLFSGAGGGGGGGGMLRPSSRLLHVGRAICSRHQKQRSTDIMVFDEMANTWSCMDGPNQCKGAGPNYPCKNCYKMGHFARDCPEPRKNPLVCNSCGREGHIARLCPTVKPTDVSMGKERARCIVHNQLRRVSYLDYDEDGNWRCKPSEPCREYQ